MSLTLAKFIRRLQSRISCFLLMFTARSACRFSRSVATFGSEICIYCSNK
jgi:hypothetical protein